MRKLGKVAKVIIVTFLVAVISYILGVSFLCLTQDIENEDFDEDFDDFDNDFYEELEKELS